MPFTYQRRHTYPIPPYSTIIGFLINALGLFDQREKLYTNGIRKLKLSIAGKFDSKVTEYIWFRNMSKKAHLSKFSYVENRENNGHVEHPGGQSPMKIDVLNDVHLIVYLGHNDLSILEEIKNNLSNPINRLEIIHLGRAEDWIVYEDEPKIIEEKQLSYYEFGGNFNHFFWIPENFYTKENGNWIPRNNESFEGLLYNLPTFSEVEGYEDNYNRHGKRSFQYIRTKLNDGLIVGQKLMMDEELNLPIFLGELNGK
jgi:CRISPR-associated protein Cas5t